MQPANICWTLIPLYPYEGGGLRPPHPHFQSAASAASKKAHRTLKAFKIVFFHERASYERWGLHNTAKILVRTIPFFFVFLRTTHLTVFLRNYSFNRISGKLSIKNISENYSFNRISGKYAFNRISGKYPFNRISGKYQFNRISGKYAFNYISDNFLYISYDFLYISYNFLYIS